MKASVQDIQTLRGRTQAGMLDCKKALEACDGDMEKAVMKAFDEQGFKFDKGYSSGYRGTDHHSFCTELGLSYSVDSGD